MAEHYVPEKQRRDGFGAYGGQHRLAALQQLDDLRSAANSTVVFPMDERTDTGQASG